EQLVDTVEPVHFADLGEIVDVDYDERQGMANSRRSGDFLAQGEFEMAQVIGACERVLDGDLAKEPTLVMIQPRLQSSHADEQGIAHEEIHRLEKILGDERGQDEYQQRHTVVKQGQ